MSKISVFSSSWTFALKSPSRNFSSPSLFDVRSCRIIVLEYNINSRYPYFRLYILKKLTNFYSSSFDYREKTQQGMRFYFLQIIQNNGLNKKQNFFFKTNGVQFQIIIIQNHITLKVIIKNFCFFLINFKGL